ncbi:hypothetical protein CKM354_000591300 [Cercospora kikuchii]|uniref:BTB domain-containing protein n=1 Tax=Cercospora kikuchii TaxID=84275 RepID=A0A9P3CE81_9PEZI|nr:uncharacterized protein CKM354_000591300 [Cercospora kikuchii]GIZ42654.1 hypothetical protein CKM354_000591300 [Cercospora kikuchii]
MFSVSKRDKSYRDSFSHRAGKSMSSKRQKSFKEYGTSKRISTIQPVVQQPSAQSSPRSASSPTSPNLNSAIVTIAIGSEQRLFAAHEDVLSKSPAFAQQIRKQFFESNGKRIDIPNELPEVFSAILEYLYKGDYTPKLEYDKKHQSWFLDDGDAANGMTESTVRTPDNHVVLKDTVIYCSAARYGLPDLQRLALKKQGLQSGVQCGTILSSARYAYANTPASDSKLRAHYLALIIRSRSTFKRSGTMQMEMEAGGSPLFFDLFVAMVNHLDDIASSARSPRT